MTVHQLIEELKQCNPDLQVYVWDPSHDLKPIEMVDDTISDRVDLNVVQTKKGIAIPVWGFADSGESPQSSTR